MRAPDDDPEREAASRRLHLLEVDSTQAEAQRRALDGERGPLWITADVQTAGRGRSGRAWLTPRHNVAATLLITPDCAPAVLPQLSLVAGVAAAEAVAAVMEAHGGLTPVRLKWPNDLLLGRAKVGGILVESTHIAGALIAMIGIGINVGQAPDLAGREVTRLADHTSAEPDPDVLRMALDRCMTACLTDWRRGLGFAAIRSAWLRYGGARGEPMTVNAGGGPVAGAFAGLDTDGALLLQDESGATRRFTFGDVTLAPAKA